MRDYLTWRELPVDFNISHTKEDLIKSAKALHKLCDYNQSEPDYLFDGNLGRVISLLNLGEYFDNPKYCEKAIELLEKVISRIGESNGIKFTSAISNGLSGLGYCLLLIEKSSFSIASDDSRKLLDWIAKTVYQKSQPEIEKSDIDTIYSSIGGIYFLSRYCALKEGNASYLNDLVDILYDKIDENGFGNYLANKRYQNDGKYHIQLGIAHGICGIVLSLLSVKEVINSNKAERMIRLSLEFLAKFYKPYQKEEKHYLFPRAVTMEGAPHSQEKTKGNIGWCTSDLSIIYTFLLSGSRLKDEFIFALGNKFLSDFLKFDQGSLPIYDVNLCHGFSGFSLLFKKCFQLTKREDALIASFFWMNKTLQNIQNQEENNFWFGKQGAYSVIINDGFDNKLPWDDILFLQ